MSFREKIVWATILFGLAPYIWYFGSVGMALLKGAGVQAYSIGGLIGTIIWGTIVLIIAVTLIAIRNRGEGSMVPDERESIIEKRGIVFSYHFLCTAVLVVIALTWWGAEPVAVIHLLALAFVFAEFGRLAIELHGLRKGF